VDVSDRRIDEMIESMKSNKAKLGSVAGAGAVGGAGSISWGSPSCSASGGGSKEPTGRRLSTPIRPRMGLRKSVEAGGGLGTAGSAAAGGGGGGGGGGGAAAAAAVMPPAQPSS
jgi:hypothetical protein